MRISFLKFKLFLIVTLCITAGCASFHPEPVSPSHALSAFEARTLDDHGLKEFTEKNLQRKITPWPPPSWDLTMLTLAALYYHPDMDVARAKRGVAEAGVVTAGGRPNPAAGLSIQHHSEAPGGISPWTWGLTLDIPIETAGKRGYRIEQAKHLSEAARLNIATAAWQVRSRLRKSLLDLYSAKQMETLLKSKEAAQEQITKMLQQRLAAGEVSQPDVTQAHISLDQTRLSLHDAQKQGSQALARLAEALGLPASALDGADIVFDFADRFPTRLPLDDIRRQALLGRSDILSALAEYAASQAALQLEIAKQYPDIHLGPSYSWDQGDNKWSFGLSVTLPVFNRNQGPIAEAEARRKEAASSFIALQAQIIGDIAHSLAGYNSDLQKLETADSLLEAQERQQQSVQALFSRGGTDRLAIVSARLERISAELSRLDALMKVQQSLGLLEDAVQRPLDPLGSFSIAPDMNYQTKEEDKE